MISPAELGLVPAPLPIQSGGAEPVPAQASGETPSASAPRHDTVQISAEALARLHAELGLPDS